MRKEVRQMSSEPKYFIVEAEALPEIYRKVARAKQALELHEAATVNEAAKLAGISRSAFYKYKDAVRPFNDMMNGHIVTFQVMLRDEPGVLSAILNIFAPETSGLLTPPEELARSLERQSGVLKMEILAG